MADWFYGKDNAQHGPVSDLEIRNLIVSGHINMDTIVWREGMSDWIPMKDVPEFQSVTGNTASSAGETTPSSDSPYVSPQTYAGQAPYTSPIPTDGLSIAALVLGILGVISCYVWALFAIPAVICGHMSLKKINNSSVPIQGKGMAIAGLVCGYIGILIQLFMIVVIVLAFSSAATSSPTYGP